jgi:glycosyltransferase involved in cell wall biosynthesis
MRVRHRLDLWAARELRRLLLAFEPQVLYAPRNSTLSIALIASRGLAAKVVGYRGTIGHLSRWDPASQLTYFHPRVDRIVCVSEAVRRYLLGLNLAPGKLVTIYKGHDVAWYDAPGRASLDLPGLPAGAFVAGFTGSIRPVKGVDVLLRAMRLLDPGRNIHLLLVGDVRDRAITRLAADPAIRGRVHLTGFRRDAARLAGACDAFVMPSVEREGLPRAVIEAMAQRVAPIVTRVGGMPELVVDGECGLVVPPRDPSALADAISALAADRPRCRALGERARRRITEAFHIDTTISKMSALFRELAESPTT